MIEFLTCKVGGASISMFRKESSLLGPPGLLSDSNLSRPSKSWEGCLIFVGSPTGVH